MALKVGINGFGRVGKTFFRLNQKRKNPKNRFDIVAIKDLLSIKNLAYLLRDDSTYGRFPGSVQVNGNSLVVDGKEIPYFQERDVSNVPWANLGVDMLLESSAAVSIEEGRRLLEASSGTGLKNVIYARNQDGTDNTLVFGINHAEYDPIRHRLVSSSTCTGNAIVPIAQIISEHFGIKGGHLSTIHPVLAEQKLVDVSHEKFPLGRSALRSIIPTPTAIAGSLGNILRELDGKLTSSSFRVPTDIVSQIGATFELERPTTPEEVNKLIQQYASGKLRGIVEYDPGSFEHPKVSIDYIKNPHAVVFAGLETKVSKGNILTVCLFHDNEWGYCSQVHKLMHYMHKRNLEK